MEKCIFCKILAGKIPAKIVYEDEHVIAFEDIHPQAPIHLLIVPRKHIATLNEANQADQMLLGHLLLTVKKLAAQLNISEPGYRVVINCNGDGGQEVFHLHLHLMGKKKLGKMVNCKL